MEVKLLDTRNVIRYSIGMHVVVREWRQHEGGGGPTRATYEPLSLPQCMHAPRRTSAKAKTKLGPVWFTNVRKKSN